MDEPVDKHEIAEGYDHIAEHIFESDSMYRDTLKLTPDCAGRVLDVGCGQGLFLSRVRDRFPEVTELHACDISPRLCEMASANVPEAKVTVADATTLTPYEDDYFDFVFMISSLEHMVEHATALSACRRVLKPGGVLVVAVPNRSWLRYDRWLELHDPTQPIDDYWFRPDELRGLLREAAFTVERTRGVWAIFRGDWRHTIENAAAAVVPALNEKFKCIAVRSRKNV